MKNILEVVIMLLIVSILFILSLYLIGNIVLAMIPVGLILFVIFTIVEFLKRKNVWKR